MLAVDNDIAASQIQPVASLPNWGGLDFHEVDLFHMTPIKGK
jgi:hypothetical protein